ncbi:MAG: 4-(cytidine 5'-diphospho)-2-C-methyl-D-erythritol kinase [Erysipelotrichaceae bacterium]|jgi:4-diphosphocytidyl-2-C-methyl-D-erythritol kinase|nr:4-(cytidine 5'-diphospho)-2-C-methyl-D-erythritol kinase [Erysipelotrichaceae bacterium]
MKERAYAKINLCLDVVGRRDDGYHELKMIMVPIDFYDVLEMNFATETTLELNRSYLPVNEKNTIIKAIRVMQEKYGFDDEFECRLAKHIPTRAGLAGGSADAAAAIRMMNRMLRLNLSMEEMIETGREVGADVPFCIMNKPALVEGIGEKIMPFKCSPDFDILLVKPRKGVSTKEAFDIVDSSENEHPDCMKLMNALIMNDYEGVVSSLGNSLEPAAIQLVKDIRTVKNRLNEMGFDGVLMSGSGSTVFGITRNAQLLNDSMEQLRQEKYFVRKTRIYTGE